MTRRSALAGGATVVLVAGGVAAGVALAFREGHRSLTPAEYLARADAVCVVYARRLDRITPPDPTSPAEVTASVGRALLVLRGQAEAVRRIRPPHELEPRVREFFARLDRTLSALQAQLEAAKRKDVTAMKARFADWLAAGVASQKASRRVGYRC